MLAFVAPYKKVEGSPFVRLDYSLELGGIDGLIVGEGVSLEADDEIEERLDVGLGGRGLGGDAEDVKAARGRLGLRGRGRLASTHVGGDFCPCLSHSRDRKQLSPSGITPRLKSTSFSSIMSR